jgi:hypothetical protein
MKKTAVIILIILNSLGCRKHLGDPRLPPVPEEEEMITTFMISFRDSASGDIAGYYFSDPDGPEGGLPGTFGPNGGSQSDSVIILKNNSTYECEILMLNESVTPVDTVSIEISEAAEEHLILFRYPQTESFSITYLDRDANNLPLGLLTRWRTRALLTEKTPLNIVLRHQDGNKDGTFEPGESELDLMFRLIIE